MMVIIQWKVRNEERCKLIKERLVSAMQEEELEAADDLLSILYDAVGIVLGIRNGVEVATRHHSCLIRMSSRISCTWSQCESAILDGLGIGRWTTAST